MLGSESTKNTQADPDKKPCLRTPWLLPGTKAIAHSLTCSKTCWAVSTAKKRRFLSLKNLQKQQRNRHQKLPINFSMISPTKLRSLKQRGLTLFSASSSEKKTTRILVRRCWGQSSWGQVRFHKKESQTPRRSRLKLKKWKSSLNIERASWKLRR